jgi:hypothetical protein
MGFRRAFLHLNWPALVCGFFAVFSSSTLLLLTKLATTALNFPYPATLALLHTGGIALMLWFWTLFGMLQPRRLPPRLVLRAAAPHAAATVLALAALRHASLSVFQATRLAVAPTVFLAERARAAAAESLPRRRRQRRRGRGGDGGSGFGAMYLVVAVVYLAAAAVVVVDTGSSRWGVAVAAAAGMAAAAAQVQTRSLLQRTSVTELQLQLATKTAAAALIAVACPFLDDYSPASPSSVLNYPFPENYTLLILLTSLLAFLSFVSMRASASRSTVSFFAVQALTVAGCAFACDRYFFIPPGAQAVPRVWCGGVAVLLAASALFSALRDGQTQGGAGRECVDGSGVGEDSGGDETEVEREQRLQIYRSYAQSVSEQQMHGERFGTSLSGVQPNFRRTTFRAGNGSQALSPRFDDEEAVRIPRSHGGVTKSDIFRSGEATG